MEAATQSRQHSRHLLATDVLRSSGTIRIRALGTSMLPSIWPGDILNIQHCEPAGLRVGDVVLVADGDRWFAHRLIAVRETGGTWSWVTRGDSVPQHDRSDANADLLGKVTSIVRRGRVIVPTRKRSLINRALGKALSRSHFSLNFALRLRQVFRPELQDEIARASGCSRPIYE